VEFDKRNAANLKEKEEKKLASRHSD